MLAETTEQVESGTSLTQEKMANTIDLIMLGACTEDDIRAFLLALVAKGETVAEIAGAASAMRKHMTVLESSRDDLVDTCGTGGDGSGTFNISTAAAIVAAGAGIAVAKHGNRSITSKTGSADVLSELGVNIEASVDVMQQSLEMAGICFCFAPLFHPAMRHVGPVRRSIEVPTIFNLLGPLCNPARAPYQLLGVGKPALRTRLSAALALLETKRAFVVCGEDGLDEITLEGTTLVTEVIDSTTQELNWCPTDFGMTSQSLATMNVENPTESAACIMKILYGEQGSSRDIVIVNAAAAISLARPHLSLQECAHQATEAIDSGAALKSLKQFGDITQS
ncbi:MAG: anthranilate phosphoribosyltransferase [Planctomycetaceae bacterium]|jgi:anthranilate phosphoribosyltransferase|nr:anthranilate phosphoribosyltransferase [Planctomycetaceae bacterium]